MTKRGFPENFLWGGALSSNQTEGNYDADGKTLNVADVFYFNHNEEVTKTLTPPDLTRAGIEKAKSEKDCTYYPKRRGIDFYNTYKEDIALLAGMGFKVFRYSICWSRIFPDVNQERPCEKGLEFYDKVVNECLKYGMEPLITLLHGDLPIQIVDEYKGWANRNVIDLYVNIVRLFLLILKVE